MFALIIGYFFRIQHWPYGTEIIYSGLGIVIFSGIISAIQYQKQNK
ncbi:GldL-related protein [Kordia sp.]